jgi:hypothetical protein
LVVGGRDVPDAGQDQQHEGGPLQSGEGSRDGARRIGSELSKRRQESSHGELAADPDRRRENVQRESERGYCGDEITEKVTWHAPTLPGSLRAAK